MKLFLLFVLAVIVFTSCQKEYQFPDLIIEGPSGGLPLSYKSVSANDPGKAYITKFVYDADKRVAKIYSVELDSTVSPISKDTFMIETFLYAGTNTVPDKLVTTYYTTNDTTYYQFDNGGRLIKDSTVSLGITTSVRKISYTTNGFTVLTTSTASYSLADSAVINADNVVFLQRSIPGYSQYTQNLQLDYDAADNPLYEQNIRPVRLHIDVTEMGWPLYSRKALKTYTQTGYQSGSFSVVNTLNSGGKLIKQNVTSNGQQLIAISYEY